MTAAAVLNYQAAYTRLRDATTTQIEQLWTQLGGLSDAEAARFVAAATASMRGSETATARLVAAYLEFLARDEGPIRFPPLDLTQVTGMALRGVDPAEVFHRPVVTARTAISKGVTFQEAMRLGRLRAGVLGQSNVMLAQRATTIERLGHDLRVVGYRRVLTGQSCPLCATASTQRYHPRAKPMPIHDHCDCTVATIYGKRDPGHIINQKLLQDLKVSGLSGDLSLSKGAARARRSVTTAERRIASLRDELKTETDVARRGRLEDRLDSWRDRQKQASAKVTEREQWLADYRAGKPAPNVTVHTHGELGPVLVPKGQHFTGPADL